MEKAQEENQPVHSHGAGTIGRRLAWPHETSVAVTGMDGCADSPVLDGPARAALGFAKGSGVERSHSHAVVQILISLPAPSPFSNIFSSLFLEAL